MDELELTDLIKELRDGYDNEPSALHKEAERMADLMNKAADCLEIRRMNVWQRIHAISSEIGRVQMTLDVSTGKSSYKAVSINDVVDSLVPLMQKYRLIVVPGSKEIIEQEQLTTTTQYGEKSQFYVRIKAEFEAVNIDRPEERVKACGYGDGIDSGDKATGKANTYARKNALLDLFNLSRGADDPDREASQEYKPIQRITGEQIKKVMALYSKEEIDKMLKRMKKGNLAEVTTEQAATMIAKRDRGLIEDTTPTF